MPKISQLTLADRMTGEEQVVLTQNGITKRRKKNDFAWKIQSDALTGGDGEYVSMPVAPPPNYTHKIAIIGDLTSGYVSGDSQIVSDIVVNSTRFGSATLDFLISVGDLSGATAGQDLATTMGVTGSNWSAYANNILAAAGNHDYNASIALFKAFDLMSNFTDTYYSATVGDIEFFFVDSNSHADNNLSSATAFRASTMGQWVENGLADSTATWKIVVFHHPAYSSGATHGSTSYMQLDWAEMGAHVVLSGHDHVYERLHLDNVVYLTVGNAGGSRRTFTTPLATSVVRLDDSVALGITYVWSTPESLTFEFIQDAISGPTYATGDKFRLVKI